MGHKITIIGAGSVGATIAYTLSITGLASECVLIDVKKDKAFGEAMDIRQGTPYSKPISIYAGDYADAAGSEIVIITSGVARKPGQSRIDLAQINVNIIKEIAPRIVKVVPNAVYVVVSNPVDVLTYAFLKVSGLPQNQVIGSGTIIDTSRLRAEVADHFNISQKNIHAYVFGEHGDSSFVPWSITTVAGLSIEDYCRGLTRDGFKTLPPDYAKMEEFVRLSGGKVIAAKGATYYAIAVSTCYICDAICNNSDTIMTVSTMLNGEFDISDVCLSYLTIVGKSGVKGHVVPKLTDEEVEKLRISANTLKDVIGRISI